MDTESIKKEFSILKEGSSVYLDSAATSLTPDRVLEAVNEYYMQYRSNTHRGLYAEAQRATTEYERAREEVAKFIGADTREVIFTGGATLSSNMIMEMLEGVFENGGEVVSGVIDHHALMLPLQRLARRKNMPHEYIDVTAECVPDEDAFVSAISTKTKVVGVTLASNVTGAVVDVKKIADKAHEVGALVVVDATAAAGHMSLDVKELDADLVFFSGHNMCGPTGIGVLYGKYELLEKLEPALIGGGMVNDVTLENATWAEVPEKFEAGTQHIAGAIGLGEAVRFLDGVGVEDIQKHARELTRYAQEELSKIEGVTLYSAPVEKNVGIVSFAVEGVHPHDVAEILGKEKVAVRAGHHCALPLHSALGIPASTRASMYLYNTKEDVDALVKGVQKVKEVFSK